jgi:SNF2 family DNA or RNA helicase
MISVKQNEDVYEIRFPYDPELIDLVKNVPQRQWNPTSKFWSIPLNKLGFFLNQVKGTRFESALNVESKEQLNVNATLDPTEEQDIPDVDISRLPFYINPEYKPMAHQLDFMKYVVGHPRRSGFILADEMRLGKTLEVLNMAMYRKNTGGLKHCLIICCINSNKYNWKAEVKEHLNQDGYILGQRYKRNGELRFESATADRLTDLQTLQMCGAKKGAPLPFFLITNIETIRYKVGRKFPIATRIVELINNGTIGMVAIDECHKNMSPTSTQGKVMLQIKKNVMDAEVEWVPMTGTPIVNRPTDCYTPLRLVDGHNFKSFYTWQQYFCVFGGYGGYDVVAYKNVPELKRILQGHMLRRLKADVLDLPPKIIKNEYVVNSSYQESLYKRVQADLRAHADEIIHDMNPLARMMKLRQVNDAPELVDEELQVTDKGYLTKNAKLTRLLEILEEIHDAGEKVVIFSNWVEPLRTVYRYVSKKYSTVSYTGTMKVADREEAKQKFINDPNCMVILGTIGALGTGHTLTVAQHVVFLEEPWTATDKFQAEDRVYGHNTKTSPVIWTLISADTIDEIVHDIVYGKAGVASYIVDNKLDLKSSPKLLEKILGAL